MSDSPTKFNMGLTTTGSPGTSSPNNHTNNTNKPVSPPPLMAIDQPNPPNVTISKNSTTDLPLPPLISTVTTNNNPSGESPNQFLLNTRQIVTASRLDPELLLTSCANKEIDDVDLDRMYMEAMLEDMKCNMSSR